MKSGLKIKTINAIRWTATASMAKVALGLVQVAVLARFLPPSDYGIMAIVLMITGFAAVISDFGISNALIQKNNITQEQRSSLYWVNVLAGFVPFGIIFLISPYIADFYNIQALEMAIRCGSVVFVINAFGQQLKVVAEKELKFKFVAIIEIVSALLGFVAAVLGALNNFGVYSLISGAITASSSVLILNWVFLSEGWRPTFRLKFSDIGAFLSFGGILTVNNIVNQLNMSIDLFLGGRLLGVTALGMYSVPRNFVLQIQYLINPIVTRVGFPLIAQVQENKNQVKDIYLKTLNMTSSINAPIYVGLFFFSEEFINIFLGDRWTAAGELMKFLTMWAGLRSTGNPAGGLIMGVGRADLLLKWNVAMLIINPFVIFVGSNYGANGMALALFLTAGVLFFPGWYILIEPLCGATFYQYSVAALRPFLLALVAGAFSLIVCFFIHDNLFRLVVGNITLIFFYLLISKYFNNYWFSSMGNFFNFEVKRGK